MRQVCGLGGFEGFGYGSSWTGIRRRKECIKVVLVSMLLLRQTGIAGEKEGLHDPAIHEGSGLKRELITGISEEDFLRLGEKPKTVKITLVNAFTDENGWLNLNGYSHGKAIFSIPEGWVVDVTFINPSPAPHSVVLVDRDVLGRVRVGEPIFTGASTINPVAGMSSAKASFTFVASRVGDYAFACGIPTHSIAGHWIGFTVGTPASKPTLKLGDATPKEAK